MINLAGSKVEGAVLINIFISLFAGFFSFFVYVMKERERGREREREREREIAQHDATCYMLLCITVNLGSLSLVTLLKFCECKIENACLCRLSFSHHCSLFRSLQIYKV